MDVVSTGFQNFPQLAASTWFPLLLTSLRTQKCAPEVKTNFKNAYDYIIVGAGASGSVVARRLSEVPCASVLLLEAGPPAPLATDIPGLNTDVFPDGIDWKYKTAPMKRTGSALKNRQWPYRRGKVLGGSTIVNTMIYTRGNRKNYDEWASLGAEGWNFDKVLPYFLKLEDETNPAYLSNGFHTSGGPITVSNPKYYPKVKRALGDAGLGLGYHFVDINGATQNGLYDPQASMRNGQRCSTAKAYLVPSEDRPNLDIVARALVTKILFEGKRAVGVEFELNGAKHQVKSRKEVIVSGGAFNTPQLLMLSGIGPKKELDKFNIPVVADLPVGKNYQDHACAYVFYEYIYPLESLTTRLSSDPNVLRYITNREGPLGSAQECHLIAFLNSNKTEELMDIPQYELQFFELTSQFVKNLGITTEALKQVFGPYQDKPIFVCFAILLNSKSVGKIRLQSTNPKDPPEIDPNLFEDPQDVEDILEAMRACHRFLSTPAMVEAGFRPYKTTFPGCKTASEDFEESLKCSLGSLATPFLHASGTAKMGKRSDKTTVVDSQLRVKSVEGLRVVDASIMPKIIWGHTNVPSIMIGEKASDMIKNTITCK